MPARTRLGVACLLFALATSWLAPVATSAQSVTPAQTPLDAGGLSRDAPVERRIEKGAIHAFTIPARAGECTDIDASTESVGVRVTMLDPTGATLFVREYEPGYGYERISFAAEAAGAYRLTVSTTRAATDYRVRIVDVHAATARDRTRMAAAKLTGEGALLGSQGTPDAARESLAKFEEALALWTALDEPVELALAEHWIGSLYGRLGEKEKSLPFLRRALERRKALGNEVASSGLLLTVGICYYTYGDVQTALDYFEESLASYRQLGIAPSISLALNWIGHANDTLARYEKALECYEEALCVLNLPPSGDGSLANNMAHAHFELGRFQTALELYDESIRYDKESGDSYFMSQTLANIGLVYYTMGDRRKALDYFDQALADEKAKTNGRPEVVATALYRSALAERDLGDLNQARVRIEAALSIVESQRMQLTDFELRAYLFAARHDYYAAYVDILMRLHERSPEEGFDVKAFEVNERGRARTLVDMLVEGSVDIRQGVDPHLLEKEKELRLKLDGRGGTGRRADRSRAHDGAPRSAGADPASQPAVRLAGASAPRDAVVRSERAARPRHGSARILAR
jgi:tetratricopeptide (TPR) repeat protein